jgi:hypothetical protein
LIYRVILDEKLAPHRPMPYTLATPDKNLEIGMWKEALAGAMVLAAAGVSPASAGERTTTTVPAASAHADAAVEAKIARAKAALRLRPDQERYWPRVAAAIREWANQPAADTTGGFGFIRRARSNMAVLSARARSAKHVVSAALPLTRTLDPDQKQTAMMMIRALGFGHLAAAM